MKKLAVPFVVIIAFYLATPLPSSAQSAGPQQINKAAGNPDCAKVKFHNLGRYKDDKWWRVFQDEEVAPALKALLKKDYPKLTQNMKRATYPEDSLSFVDRKGVLTLRGFVPGLFTIMEAMLIVEPCGNIYTAILDEGDQFLYFSNDQEYVDRLPPSIEEWRTGIEQARSKFQKQPELPVVYKSK
jgi:hypothetical protein